MYKIVIAEDETIVRSTLTALINQHLEDFQVQGEFSNGALALEHIRTNPPHLLITDIKMPNMDGITLISHVQQLPVKPIILVISAYNDFQLVRDAFRLGAVDYILKTNIDKDYILKLAKNVRPQLEKSFPFALDGTAAERYKPDSIKEVLDGTKAIPEDLVKKQWYTAVIMEIDTFTNQIERFRSRQDMLALRENIIQVMSQISRLAKNGRIFSISAHQYGFLYELDTADMDEVNAVCEQVIRVLRTYLNMQVTIGVGSFRHDLAEFVECCEDAKEQLAMKYIMSHGKVFLPESRELVDRKIMLAGPQNYKGLMEALKQAKYVVVQAERQEVFAMWKRLPFEQVKQEALSLICQLAQMLEDNDDHIVYALNQDANYYEKINKLHSAVDVEMWMTNFLNWVLDYIEVNYDKGRMDDIDKAKRFIADFYSDPTISLSAVADYVGLNEKYLSTKFTKETGTTFSSYLTGIRMAKAKELLAATDLKIYEISERVGYLNAEHFMRMFKKVCKVSANTFRKQNI